MNVQEINNKIADLEKRSKNPSLPASAVTSLNKMIADLKAQVKGAPTKPAEPTKAEPKKAEPKAKPEPKAKAEPKPKAEAKNPEDEDDYCDKVIKQAKERRAKAKANAKKRANEPKKTPATKNKEKVEKTNEKVYINIEKRAEKGEVSKGEILKMIAEHTEAIKKLNKLLAKLK